MIWIVPVTTIRERLHSSNGWYFIKKVNLLVIIVIYLKLTNKQLCSYKKYSKTDQWLSTDIELSSIIINKTNIQKGNHEDATIQSDTVMKTKRIILHFCNCLVTFQTKAPTPTIQAFKNRLKGIYISEIEDN